MLSSRSRLAASETREVARLIKLTADHHAAGDRLTRDEAKLIDIDLSILGQPWPVYQEYMRGVRQEFCPAVTSEARFRVGRMAFLERVLRQRRIFMTEAMAAQLEATARSNISREIDLLGTESGLLGRVPGRLLG